jgi:fucose permease
VVTPTQSKRRVGVLLGLSYVGFISLGLPDGLLGVAWPSIRARFGLELDAIGPLLVATTTGYVFASFSSGRLLARGNLGALLAASRFAAAASLLGYALAPAWSVLVGFGFFAGIGAGLLDAGLNTYVAMHHSARTLNWVHACYGVGAAGGPALMTTVLLAKHPWQRGYWMVAAGQLALALCFVATRSFWPSVTSHASTPGAKPASGRATLALPAAWFGMAAFFLAVGIEQSAGAWAYSFLTEARGVSVAAAGTWSTLFWVALTAGRVVFGLVANRVPIDALVRTALVAIGVACALVAFDPFPMSGEIGLLGIGFATGPIFPLLIATTPARFGGGHAANGVGFQIGAASLAQALIPWLIGGAARRSSLEVLGPILLGCSLLLLALHELLVRHAASVRASVPGRG